MEPSAAISVFRSPAGLVGSFDLNELEHTSSANQPEVCAGVIRAGRIS